MTLEEEYEELQKGVRESVSNYNTDEKINIINNMIQNILGNKIPYIFLTGERIGNDLNTCISTNLFQKTQIADLMQLCLIKVKEDVQDEKNR